MKFFSFTSFRKTVLMMMMNYDLDADQQFESSNFIFMSFYYV